MTIENLLAASVAVENPEQEAMVFSTVHSLGLAARSLDDRPFLATTSLHSSQSHLIPSGRSEVPAPHEQTDPPSYDKSA